MRVDQLVALGFLAAHHAYRHGVGWTEWLTHIALSSVIRGLIYGLIFKVMHRFTLADVVILVIIVLSLLFIWGRSRDRRGW